MANFSTMMVAQKIKELQQQILVLREKGSIGFVPTMGALHRGHLSLVEQAARENPVVVVSIFVNPTQFNDPADLQRYPKNLGADLELLETTPCDLVFAPSPEEVYPEPDTRKFYFGQLEAVMEGTHRPGHFNGVAQVVTKLFEMVKPDKAYFGLKDFQQLTIIQDLVQQLEYGIEIVTCPIVREKNGLAMSSRNELLSPKERETASLIYETLEKAKNLTGSKSVQELVDWVKKTINKNPLLSVEYFEVVDSKNLLPVNNWNGNKKTVGCIAVRCGKIRLIDNIFLN